MWRMYPEEHLPFWKGIPALQRKALLCEAPPLVIPPPALCLELCDSHHVTTEGTQQRQSECLDPLQWTYKNCSKSQKTRELDCKGAMPPAYRAAKLGTAWGFPGCLQNEDAPVSQHGPHRTETCNPRHRAQSQLLSGSWWDQQGFEVFWKAVERP